MDKGTTRQGTSVKPGMQQEQMTSEEKHGDMLSRAFEANEAKGGLGNSDRPQQPEQALKHDSKNWLPECESCGKGKEYSLKHFLCKCVTLARQRLCYARRN